MIRWVIGAIAGLAMAAAAQVAEAQTIEATRWFTPHLNQGDTVFVYNIGARPARVMQVTVARTDQTQDRSEVRLVQPGGGAGFLLGDERPAMVVIVSDEPVYMMVERRRSIPFQSRYTEFYNGASPVGQMRVPSRSYAGTFVENHPLVMQEEVRGEPVDCSGAPAGHFICSMRLPSIAEENAGGLRPPRAPTDNGQAPPARQPEPRLTPMPEYTRAPGPAPAPTPRRPR